MSDWPEVGIGIESGVPKRDSSSRSQRLWKHWLAAMNKAAFRKQTSVFVYRPVFNKHMRLLAERGFSEEDICALFDRFAAAVETGAVNVHQKSAFYVFCSTWHRLKGLGVASYTGGDVDIEQDHEPNEIDL